MDKPKESISSKRSSLKTTKTYLKEIPDKQEINSKNLNEQASSSKNLLTVKNKQRVSLPDNQIQQNSFLQKNNWDFQADQNNGTNLDEELNSLLPPIKQNILPRVHPTINDNIISDQNFNYNKTFEFTRDEVQESFDILDRTKQGFITESEIAFFLNILDISATKEEILEMVKMVDSKEDNKIRFDDFFLMAKGYLMSPIGLAFPPTISMLESKNLRKDTLLREQIDILKEENNKKRFNNSKNLQVTFKVENNTLAVNNFESKIIAQSIPKQNEIKTEFNKSQRKEKLENLFKTEQFNFKKIFEFFKTHNTVNINIVDFDTFVNVCEFKDKKKAAELFQSVLRPPSKNVDFQELLVNWIAIQKWTIGNKAYMGFYVLDKDGNGILNIDNLVDLITWLHFEEHPGNRKKIMQQIFEQLKIESESLIDLKIFEEIISGYENILFSTNVFTNNEREIFF